MSRPSTVSIGYVCVAGGTYRGLFRLECLPSGRSRRGVSADFRRGEDITLPFSAVKYSLFLDVPVRVRSCFDSDVIMVKGQDYL